LKRNPRLSEALLSREQAAIRLRERRCCSGRRPPARRRARKGGGREQPRRAAPGAHLFAVSARICLCAALAEGVRELVGGSVRETEVWLAALTPGSRKSPDRPQTPPPLAGRRFLRAPSPTRRGSCGDKAWSNPSPASAGLLRTLSFLGGTGVHNGTGPGTLRAAAFLHRRRRSSRSAARYSTKCKVIIITLQ
jgi:hypothetical protein